MASGQQGSPAPQTVTPVAPATPAAPAQPVTSTIPATAAPARSPGSTPAIPGAAKPITVVQVVERPTREISVGDILLGSVGFVGTALLAALLVGLLAGAVFIFVKRLLPGNTFNGQTADDAALKLNSLSDSQTPRD